MAAVGAVLFVPAPPPRAAPLIPHGAFGAAAAWGSLLVSFFVGAALIAALVDIPIFARLTVAEGSQIKAALVLLEFLVALPDRRARRRLPDPPLPAGVVTAVGMVLAALGFWLMAGWGLESLEQPARPRRAGDVRASASAWRWRRSTPRCSPAPTSASTAWPARCSWSRGWWDAGRHLGADHDRAAPLLRRRVRHPRAHDVCDGGKTRCAAYERLLEQAGIEQLQAIFLGAAVCARRRRRARARCFRGARTRGVTADRACSAPASFLPRDLTRLRRPARRQPRVRRDLRPGGFDGVAHAGIAIVTCMDSRIAPLRMLGLVPGDAKIFRNPGGRVTPQALEALVLGVHLLRSSGSWSSRTPAARWPRPRSTSCAPRSASPPVRTRPGSPSAWSRTRRARSRTTSARSRSHPLIPDIGRGRRVPVRRRHRAARAARLARHGSGARPAAPARTATPRRPGSSRRRRARSPQRPHSVPPDWCHGRDRALDSSALPLGAGLATRRTAIHEPVLVVLDREGASVVASREIAYEARTPARPTVGQLAQSPRRRARRSLVDVEWTSPRSVVAAQALAAAGSTTAGQWRCRPARRTARGMQRMSAA